MMVAAVVVISYHQTKKTEELVLLRATIRFIDCWLQGLEQNLLLRSNMYFETIKKLFQKIPVELLKPPSPKGKIQSLLHSIGGGWYMKKLNENLLPLKKRKPEKNHNKRRIK